MEFKDAVDEVCAPISHADVAKSLGVSLQTVRQARLSSQAKAFRAAPNRWRDAMVRLAEERVWHYRKLIETLRQTKD
jgi:hypothetical protein